jgi:hypothetical protein
MTGKVGMRALRRDRIENAVDRMKRLRALAHEARAAGQIKYAELLEQQALKAAAEPDGWKTRQFCSASQGRAAECGSVGKIGIG